MLFPTSKKSENQTSTPLLSASLVRAKREELIQELQDEGVRLAQKYMNDWLKGIAEIVKKAVYSGMHHADFDITEIRNEQCLIKQAATQQLANKCKSLGYTVSCDSGYVRGQCYVRLSW